MYSLVKCVLLLVVMSVVLAIPGYRRDEHESTTSAEEKVTSPAPEGAGSEKLQKDTLFGARETPEDVENDVESSAFDATRKDFSDTLLQLLRQYLYRNPDGAEHQPDVEESFKLSMLNPGFPSFLQKFSGGKLQAIITGVRVEEADKEPLTTK